MIHLDGASVQVGRSFAIRDLRATFAPGTVSALVGGDGAGKSSLLRALADRRGRGLLGVHGIAPGQVGYQSAGSGTWPALSVRENLEFVASAFDLAGAEPRIAELITAARLDEAEGRIAARLSGGMRRKLGTIMAMLPSPALLLLDEPTTGVDPDSRATLWDLLRSAADEGATVLVATTYLDEAERADQVLLMDKGTVLASGTAAEVAAATPGRVWRTPVQAMDEGGVSGIGVGTSEVAAREVGAMEMAGVQHHIWQRGRNLYEWTSRGLPKLDGAAPARLDLELSTIAFLLDASSGAGAKQDEASGEQGLHELRPALVDTCGMSPEWTASLIRCEGVVKRFGAYTALDGVALDVGPGEVVGLVGGNGAGKSTLIRLLLGIDTVDEGRIELFGGPPGRAARRMVGYVPQSLGLYPALSARENLEFISAAHGSAGDIPEDGLFASSTPVGRLPAGAQREVAVACALNHHPRLLVLDEPTSGMDSLGRALLWKRVRRAAAEGAGVLVTTHYQQEARQCDRVVHLEAGRLVAPGTRTTRGH